MIWLAVFSPLGALSVTGLAYFLWYVDHEARMMHGAPRGARDSGRHAAIPPHPRYAGIPGMEGPSVPIRHAAPPAVITDCPAVRSDAAWDSGSSGIHAAIRN